MTLINDNVDLIKASLITAIKKELVETYPKQFGDYKNGNGGIYTKIYWENTVRYKPKFPICVLSTSKDVSERQNEISYFKDEDGKYKKRVVKSSFLTVGIDIFDMGNESINYSNLQADTFTAKVARQLRSYFNGDEKLDWFSGNEIYPNQIGIVVDDEITTVNEWDESDNVIFRKSFDVTLGWDEEHIYEVPLAEGVVGTLNNNYDFTFKFNKQNI